MQTNQIPVVSMQFVRLINFNNNHLSLRVKLKYLNEKCCFYFVSEKHSNTQYFMWNKKILCPDSKVLYHMVWNDWNFSLSLSKIGETNTFMWQHLQIAFYTYSFFFRLNEKQKSVTLSVLFYFQNMKCNILFYLSFFHVELLCQLLCCRIIVISQQWFTLPLNLLMNPMKSRACQNLHIHYIWRSLFKFY